MKSWLEIAGERLSGNFAALRRVIAESSDGSPGHTIGLLAVVKANAYGHGIDPCAAILTQAGAEWLGVTDAREGAALRAALTAAGIDRESQPEVLVMCGTAALKGEAELIATHGLTAVVWNLAEVAALAAAARHGAVHGVGQVAVHVEIDTGMTRQGVAPGHALAELLAAIQCEPSLRLGGVFTHLASTEVAGSEQTAEQQRRFAEAIAQLAALQIQPDFVHIGNSSYIDNGADSSGTLPWLRGLAESVGARSMVRAGLALYGYLLPLENSLPVGDATALVGDRVRPVMTWKTHLIDVWVVEAGARVGYNGIYTAQRPMRLALLPVGYADGLRRELSGSNERSGGWVMIRGQRAAIVGRISMNLTTVDVTEIDGAAAGDEAILLGEGVTADDHARVAGTIPYEILCGVKAG